RLRERKRDADRVEARAEQAESSECREQPDPRNGGRQDERQFDECHRERASSQPAARAQERERRAPHEDEAPRRHRPLGTDDERVSYDRVGELTEEVRRRGAREDRRDREQQEDERNSSSRHVRDDEQSSGHYFFLTRGRKPAAISFFCAAPAMRRLTNVCASALCVLAVTT